MRPSRRPLSETLRVVLLLQIALVKSRRKYVFWVTLFTSALQLRGRFKRAWRQQSAVTALQPFLFSLDNVRWKGFVLKKRRILQGSGCACGFFTRGRVKSRTGRKVARLARERERFCLEQCVRDLPQSTCSPSPIKLSCRSSGRHHLHFFSSVPTHMVAASDKETAFAKQITRGSFCRDVVGIAARKKRTMTRFLRSRVSWTSTQGACWSQFLPLQTRTCEGLFFTWTRLCCWLLRQAWRYHHLATLQYQYFCLWHGTFFRWDRELATGEECGDPVKRSCALIRATLDVMLLLLCHLCLPFCLESVPSLPQH